MPDTNERSSILVVDDDDALRTAVSRTLSARGFEITTAANGRAAIELFSRKRFDAIVSDITMPELDGIGLLRKVREHDLDVPVILVTGSPSLDTALAAVEHGALRYLKKPVLMPDLVAVVERGVQLGQLARLKREALEHLGEGSHALGDRPSLEGGFVRALAGLWMAYQPIVQLPSRRLYAYEALLRSTEKSLPHPGAILEAAQKLGRLGELGAAVRRSVATTLSKSPVPLVFMNVHPNDLVDDELYSPKAPLSSVATRIVLEVTERASLDEIPDLQMRIAKLRGLGYRVAIDDIGAGYAGLNSIVNVQPEVMKIDMSLVRDIDVDFTRQKLVGAMIRLCEDMGASVICEGVETRTERDTILRLGGSLMQGYFFGRPGEPFPEARFE